MKFSTISYRDSKAFSNLINDYLDGKDELRPFYKYAPNIDSIPQVIKDKSENSVNRELLLHELLEQNKNYLSTYNLVETNIQKLKNKTSFTITTGHQLCVFGGPLYFITKALSVIALTRRLKMVYPSYDFIPVFWLATEDHGNGEIGGINLFGKHYPWGYQNEKGEAGKRSNKGAGNILESLSEVITNNENGRELHSLFTQAYNDTSNIGEATRDYLYQLFGKYGLVIMDGDSKDLKQELKPIFKREIEEQIVYNSVGEVADRLAEKYHAQLNPNKLNLFYLEENKRTRIDIVNNGFELADKSKKWTKDELLKEVDDSVERFSPNVVLRTVYQEKVLPNLAYVGGPGETAYWLEMKQLYELLEINFPMILVRDSLQFFDSKSLKKLSKLGFSLQDAFLEEGHLIDLYLTNNTESIDFSEEQAQVKALFDSLSAKIVKIDGSLRGASEKERALVLKQLNGLEKRTKKAVKLKHETAINQLSNFRNKHFPNNNLLERHENFMSLYLKFGEKLFTELLTYFNAFSPEVYVLKEA